MNKRVASLKTTAFTASEAVSGSLSASSAASLLAAVGDVTLILSADGIVLDVAVSQSDLANRGFTDWIGGPWIDTVTQESRSKITEMLDSVGDTATPSRWRQVNQIAAGGEVPIRYLLMELGDSERLIAIGRDMLGASAMQQRLLETQQSLERDYVRLRQAETRYRMLFDMALEPVLIIDAQTRRIRESNPAACRLLEAEEGALIGDPVDRIVDAQDRDDFIAYLGAAEAADDVAPLQARLSVRSAPAVISARLFRQARTPLLLVRIALVEASSAHDQFTNALGEVVERMPDAFVLVDRDFAVLKANTAFIELTEMASLDRVTGARLSTWLGRPGIDLELIVAQLREHGAVRNVATVMRGSAGSQEEIEVSGVVAPMGSDECYGFTIRNVGRRPRPSIAAIDPGARSVEQLTGLVGRMSLKEIVRESADMVERLCIEAALAYTSDNRASAAEVLGVSRQSLYSKLHRHKLGDLVSGED